MAAGKPADKARRSRLDWASVGGVTVAGIALFGGLLLEGGKLADLQQMTAALIVLGGTLGAVMVTTPIDTLVLAARISRWVFVRPAGQAGLLLNQLMGYGHRVRRDGLVSLEDDLQNEPNPFLAKALSLAVDGTGLQELKHMLETDMMLFERRYEPAAAVYEAAGGYSPTIGIIGAVIGLIQVMKHLEDIDKVGPGIAVAFVATVYGVAAANIIFLPAAQKIRARIHHELHLRAMVVEGVSGLLEGVHPGILRNRLEAYLPEQGRNPGPAQARTAAGIRSQETTPAGD